MKLASFSLFGLLLLGAIALFAGSDGFAGTAYAGSTFIVNSEGDAGDSYLPDGICDTANDPNAIPPVPPNGICTLRAAIQQANSNVGLDTVVFSGGVQSIAPLSGLPTITDPVVIDGTTAGLVELNGAAAGVTDGLTLQASDSVLRGLVINRFNGRAIRLGPGSDNTVVEGNFIGTDRTGTQAAGNAGGITVSSARNLIGGVTLGARNLISGNASSGIGIFGDDNQVKGNYIGTDISGAVPLGAGIGVVIEVGSGNTVGGTTPAERNVISGNSSGGVYISAGSGNQVLGNYIGTDATGTLALGNGDQHGGLEIVDSSGNTIGGALQGAGNVISGNRRYGINIVGGNAGATNNIVQGNFIGTDVSGTLPLGNQWDGVHIEDGQFNNIVGNVIAFNGDPGSGWAGIAISAGISLGFSSIGNSILSNEVYANAGLGISLDLGSPVPLPNDPGDGDIGANNLQNYPVLTTISAQAIDATITGTLNSTPNSTFDVQFFSNSACDPSGFGEGETWIGSSTVITDSAGDVGFTATLPSASLGQFITATATDSNGSTSEFSACAGFDTDGDGLPDTWETGGFAGVDLAALGADPLRKDIFLWVDWLSSTGHTHGLMNSSKIRLEEAFADAPVNNPDGSTGITLHVVSGPQKFAEDTGNQQIGSFDASCYYSWAEFDALKAQSSFWDVPGRERIFHYTLFAHDLPSPPCVPGFISGISRGFGASDLIVSLGHWTDSVGSPTEQAGTLMHELGHNLGLRHGGLDDLEYKPNHLSIMNYLWQMSGLVRFGIGGILDYSRFDSSDLPTLDEGGGLNEPAGFGAGPAVARYATSYYCGVNQQFVLDIQSTPIDWNCVPPATETGVAVSINSDTDLDQLSTVDEWTRLVYDGGSIGASGFAYTAPPVTGQTLESHELTFEEDQEIIKIADGNPVGGIAELPEVVGTPLDAPESSGTNTGLFASIAGAVAAVTLALGGAAWYARRRWAR